MASSCAAAGREGAASDTFRFEVSLAVPESQMVAWFEQARAGERIVYCRGFIALREDAAWKLAGAWAREGLVNLVTERDGAQMIWLAERSSAGPRAPRVKRDFREDLARTQQRALLAVLRRAADRGEACPSRSALAREVCGVVSRKGRDRVGYLLRRLVNEKRIAVAAGDATRAPVVTILAKGRGFGKSTRSSSEAVAQKTTRSSSEAVAQKSTRSSSEAVARKRTGVSE
jgi:hypothetical protein